MREALGEDGLHVVGDRLGTLSVRRVHSEVFHNRCGDVEGFMSECTVVFWCVVELHRPQVVHTGLYAWMPRLHREPKHHAPCILRNLLLALTAPHFCEVFLKRHTTPHEQEDAPFEDGVLHLESHGGLLVDGLSVGVLTCHRNAYVDVYDRSGRIRYDSCFGEVLRGVGENLWEGCDERITLDRERETHVLAFLHPVKALLRADTLLQKRLLLR